jgi:putative phosphoribosyl transferase
MPAAFIDRIDAGERLAEALSEYRGANAIVLALPRGGVVVGYAVAENLQLPLEALVVRKLGAPQNPELAIGAVSENGVRWLDYAIVREVGATERYIEREVAAQLAEAERRQREYRGSAGLEAVLGRTAIVVDDGIATGATALVAVQSARRLGATRVVLATPVTSLQAANFLRQYVDQFVALRSPDPFLAVGMHYEHFGQVTDEEVVAYLQKSYEL